MKTVSWSLLWLLLGCAPGVAQPAAHRVIDPFFFVEYDPAKVHFDRMPGLMGGRCPQMRDHYVEAWVYGHLNTDNAEYYIVDGYVRVESEDHPGVFSVVPEDGFGFVIELSARGCVVDPTPYVFFPELNKQKSPAAGIRIPDSVLDAISHEMLERYARAFGGKKAFLRRIQQVKRDELPRSVRGGLERFEKSGGNTSSERTAKP